MKKLNTPISKHTLTALLFTIVSLAVNAQKLPQIQEVSVRAPDNIKIDGKLNEWPSPNLQANNSADRIRYVMSNDDNYLYLAAIGTGQRTGRKILNGGFILTISHYTDKKARTKATDNVVVTFPMALDANTASGIMGTLTLLGNYVDDTVANRKQIDSVVLIANKKASTALKEIRITGVKGLDTVISVYNEYGIKGAMQFKVRLPVIEIAIPLKYLGLSINDPVKFSYNIRLNAEPEPDPSAMKVSNVYIPAPIITPNPSSVAAVPNTQAPDPPNPDMAYTQNNTDFWGEYILAKKP